MADAAEPVAAVVVPSIDSFSWARDPDGRTPWRGGGRLRMRSTLRKRPGDAWERTHRRGVYTSVGVCGPPQAALARSRRGEKAAFKMASSPAAGRERTGAATENTGHRISFSVGDGLSILTGIQARNDQPRSPGRL